MEEPEYRFAAGGFSFRPALLCALTQRARLGKSDRISQ